MQPPPLNSADAANPIWRTPHFNWYLQDLPEADWAAFNQGVNDATARPGQRTSNRGNSDQGEADVPNDFSEEDEEEEFKGFSDDVGDEGNSKSPTEGGDDNGDENQVGEAQKEASTHGRAKESVWPDCDLEGDNGRFPRAGSENCVGNSITRPGNELGRRPDPHGGRAGSEPPVYRPLDRTDLPTVQQLRESLPAIPELRLPVSDGLDNRQTPPSQHGVGRLQQTLPATRVFRTPLPSDPQNDIESSAQAIIGANPVQDRIFRELQVESYYSFEIPPIPYTRRVIQRVLECTRVEIAAILRENGIRAAVAATNPDRSYYEQFTTLRLDFEEVWRARIPDREPPLLTQVESWREEAGWEGAVLSQQYGINPSRDGVAMHDVETFRMQDCELMVDVQAEENAQLAEAEEEERIFNDLIDWNAGEGELLAGVALHEDVQRRMRSPSPDVEFAHPDVGVEVAKRKKRRRKVQHWVK